MYYVQSNMPTPQEWFVNGQVVIVQPAQCVGFIEQYDMEHFVQDNRAVFLGEFRNDQDLLDAIAAHERQHARATREPSPNFDPDFEREDVPPTVFPEVETETATQPPVQPEPRRRPRGQK
jgi:hypothetical protein